MAMAFQWRILSRTQVKQIVKPDTRIKPGAIWFLCFQTAKNEVTVIKTAKHFDKLEKLFTGIKTYRLIPGSMVTP